MFFFVFYFHFGNKQQITHYSPCRVALLPLDRLGSTVDEHCFHFVEEEAKKKKTILLFFEYLVALCSDEEVHRAQKPNQLALLYCNID